MGRNFRASLVRRHLPRDLVDEIVTAFEFDPDMPSPPPADARFSVVYETLTDGSRPARSTLKAVTLDDGRKVHRVYRYQISDGDPAFLQSDGQGIALVRFGQPLAVERVTSPFGWRMHPVFGDRRFHKGVDLGAPTGTAVVAAAD